MLKKSRVRKSSLALVLVLLISMMAPIVGYAASYVKLFYNSNTGELNGLIYGDPYIGKDVYDYTAIDIYTGQVPYIGTDLYTQDGQYVGNSLNYKPSVTLSVYDASGATVTLGTYAYTYTKDGYRAVIDTTYANLDPQWFTLLEDQQNLGLKATVVPATYLYSPYYEAKYNETPKPPTKFYTNFEYDGEFWLSIYWKSQCRTGYQPL